MTLATMLATLVALGGAAWAVPAGQPCVGNECVGTEGNDTIYGSEGGDYLYGGSGGDDHLYGLGSGSGWDYLDGGYGDDTILGGRERIEPQLLTPRAAERTRRDTPCAAKFSTLSSTPSAVAVPGLAAPRASALRQRPPSRREKYGSRRNTRWCRLQPFAEELIFRKATVSISLSAI